MLSRLETTVPLSHAQATIDALSDLIDDALETQTDPTDSIRIIMGFARDTNVATIVFRRVMEDNCPSYDVLVSMLKMTACEQAYTDLLAFAQARDEADDLRVAMTRLALWH